MRSHKHSLKNGFPRGALPILLTFILVSAFSPPSSDHWQLKKEVDNIQVYYRMPEDSKFYEIKTIGIIKTPIPEILTILRDVSGFEDWVYSCKSARVLETVSDTMSYYYSEIAFPWPLRNRDFVARSVIHPNEPGTPLVINVEAVPDHYPEQNDLVRLPLLKVDWILTPITPLKTRVEYLLKTDPGGSIPAWMVNMAIDKGPLQSMQQLIQLVE